MDTVLFDATGTLISVRRGVGDLYARLAAAHGERLDAARVEVAFKVALASAPDLAFPETPLERLEDAERAWWRRVVAATVRAARDPAGPAGLTGGFGHAASDEAGFEGDGAGERFRDFFDDLYAAFAGPAPWRVEPRAREVLSELAARGYVLGVLSNFDSRLPGLLAALGLGSYLAAVMTSSEAGAAKPDPRAFQAALGRLGREASSAAHVGDSAILDGAGAAAAGLAPVLIRADPPEGVPGLRVESLTELLDLFPRVGAALPRPCGSAPAAQSAPASHTEDFAS